MSKYYIYKMISEKGCYIGQHKISKKCPFKDGYKGSGSDWKKHVLGKVKVEKVILRMCDSVEEANYWERYYITNYNGYLWNILKGGGNRIYNKKYTEEDWEKSRLHHKEMCKKWEEENKERRRFLRSREEYKQKRKEYREKNVDKIKMLNKKWLEDNKETLKEKSKIYYEENRENILQKKKKYREKNVDKIKTRESIYNNRQCLFEGETLTFNALKIRFRKAGIKSPSMEAKKYLIKS